METISPTNQAKSSVFIVGSRGFLGSALVENLTKCDILIEPVPRDSVDLSKSIPESFLDTLKSKRARYVIICAAITDVERCFLETEFSHRINVTGTIELLEVIKKSGATPVFFSSDYVFKPEAIAHKEYDVRDPRTIYGRQKLSVEHYIETHFDRFLVFRTSKLMSKSSHEKNILLPIIRSLSDSRQIRCFIDQWLNPVFVEDIVRVLEIAFTQDLKGTFHLGTRQVFSRFELGKFLARAMGFDASLIQPIQMTDIKFSEDRPSHNILDCSAVENALKLQFSEIDSAIPALKKII